MGRKWKRRKGEEEEEWRVDDAEKYNFLKQSSIPCQC
jgi:hypothetical protein